MVKPIKLTKDRQGESFYPATTTDAVVDRKRVKVLSEILNDIDDAIQNGTGVSILDSVDKLDTNAPSGSLATVSNIKTEEIEVEDKFSVRDIYVEENPDCEPLMELKLKVPETWPTEELMLIFGPKGYDNIDELTAGRYCGLIYNIEGALLQIMAFENMGTKVLDTNLVSDSVINEDALTQINEIISSWGGIVLYGQAGEGQELLTPTEAQIDSIDSFIGYSNGTHIETIETHTNDIYFKETTGWRKINDIKIVDSVDKLDKNAPQGSLASVAVNTGGEVPFSELYQPTSDEVDFNAGVVDTTNLSRVSGITINSSYDTSAEIQDPSVYLLSKDIDFQGEVGQMIALVSGEAMVWNFATKEQNQLELFTQNEDGTITINEENLATINNLLSTAEFVYGGVISMESGEFLDPSYADVFYKSISGVQKTDLYIKGADGWKVVGDEELKNQISDLEVNLTNLEDTVTNLEDKTTLIVNSVDELDPDAPTGTLANVVYGDQPILKPISEQGIKQIVFGDFVGESFIIPEDNFSIVFSASNPMYQTNLSVSYSSDASTVDLYKGVVLGNSNKLCSYKIDTKEITELDQQAIDNLNTNLKNGKLYGSTYVPSGVNEEECYKFFDQFIKNEVGYIPATVYSYTKYESGWEQYDKILKSRNVFNSPDELDTNSELGYVCSVVETSNKPRYLPLNNGTVGTLEFGYFNTGEFIDLPADIVNLSISQGFSISGSLPVHTNKLSVTKDLTTNRIIFNFRNYLNNSNPIIEFDISTLSFVQPSPSLLFVAMGNCNFSTSESNLEFLSQFFIQRVYPKVTKLYTKNEIGWEQYNEIVDRAVTAEKLAYQSVTTDKVADKAIAFDKLSNNIQKILTFAIQHFGIVTFKD